VNVVAPLLTLALTSMGQPTLTRPVSIASANIRCFLVVPPSGVVIPSTKSVGDAASMTGVPVMPSGSMLPHGMADKGTGAPRFLNQTFAPVAPLNA
jgi:hypothetical protein